MMDFMLKSIIPFEMKLSGPQVFLIQEAFKWSSGTGTLDSADKEPADKLLFSSWVSLRNEGRTVPIGIGYVLKIYGLVIMIFF